jgi:hypothetical protein
MVGFVGLRSSGAIHEVFLRYGWIAEAVPQVARTARWWIAAFAGRARAAASRWRRAGRDRWFVNVLTATPSPPPQVASSR